jgi:hypothetical protein
MQRHFAQRLAFALAVLCYLAALGCGVAAVVYDSATAGDPVRAALMASVVFFIGCGVVLHVIATTRLKGILSGREHEGEHRD